MEGISIATSTNFDTAFELLQQRILFVHKEYERIEQREASLSQGKSLDHEKNHDLLSSKSVFSFCLEELQKLHSGLKHDLYLTSTISNTDDPALDNIFEDACVEDPSNVLMYDDDGRAPVEMEVAPHICSFQKWPSLYEGGAVINPGGSCDMERYLCISTSFWIYCIDFCRDWPEGYSSELQPVPIIYAAKLLEMGLPTSMGLFKLGSDTCVIGGQEFPVFEKRPVLSLYEKYDFKGSSRKTYHLSLALPDDGLSISECHNAPLLKMAKSWPIVEQIGNRIHVIESIPCCFYPPATIPSHEVLDLDDLGHGWIKLPSMRHPIHKEWGMFIRYHLVVGDRLYAKIVGHCTDYLVFESNTNEWKLHEDPRSTNHVTDFLGVGNLICVGEHQSGELGERLYVVIGVRHIRIGDVLGDDTEMIAEAHLVNQTGHVIHTQQLPCFFEGFKWPSRILNASMFKQGKTVCVVIQGRATNCVQNFLYISTFTVEAVAPKPPSSISALSAHNTTRKYRKGRRFPSNAINLLGDFVNVVVKERHVYQLGSELWEEGWIDTAPARLTACFL